MPTPQSQLRQLRSGIAPRTVKPAPAPEPMAPPPVPAGVEEALGMIARSLWVLANREPLAPVVTIEAPAPVVVPAPVVNNPVTLHVPEQLPPVVRVTVPDMPTPVINVTPEFTSSAPAVTVMPSTAPSSFDVAVNRDRFGRIETMNIRVNG